MGAAIRRQRRIGAALDAGVDPIQCSWQAAPERTPPDAKAVHRRFAEFKIEARRRRR
jgi:hypothetical protein